MTHVLACSLILFVSQPPGDVLRISATLDAEELSVGSHYEIVLKVEIKEGWSAAAAGVPAPLVQIEVPPSVELSGKVLTSQRELSKNEYLQAPFERLLKSEEEHIGFSLVKAPGANEQISLNIMAYVSQDPTVDSFFIRRRFALDVKPRALAVGVVGVTSNWGIDKHLLQIGDPAEDFSLPKAFDPPIGLGNYLGQKNIIVMTYRAHW
ncbi:MAG: hypothetical protein O7D91_08485 [Planctomycetota bacterium]|nr:hypothetical protein [Planctomycetota bacterium]